MLFFKDILKIKKNLTLSLIQKVSIGAQGLKPFSLVP